MCRKRGHQPPDNGGDADCSWMFNVLLDLLVPFQSGWYYKKEMGGSFSIKSVLLAICPDDPEMDYHELEGVHNGSEAMSVFPRIQYMEEEEREAC